MRNKLVLLIAALVLSLACTSQAIVVGDFEGGFDGWLPAGASTLSLSTVGATTGAGSLLIEGPGSSQMLAKLDIKSLRATLGVADAAVSIDVSALAADMRIRPFWMNMEVIINGQNNNDSGAHNNIGWQSLGALDIVGNGVPQTLRWQVPDDLSAKIAGTDDNIQWFELLIVTNNAATNTKIYVDNVQLLEPEPPTRLKIIWVSRHGADDAPSAGAAGQGFTEAPDKGYTDLLKANGYDVTRYIGTGTPDVNVLNAADLVIIGRNNDAYGHYHYSNGTATKWNGISAPMIIMHGYTLQTCCLGYATGGTMGQDMVDTTGDITLTVDDPNHPIFAGIPLTAGAMTNPYAGLAVYPTDGTTVTGGISIDTGPVNTNGTVLATISAAGNGPVGGTLIAEWPAGATLTHGAEPGTDTLGGHRLVFLSGARQASGKSVHTAGIYDLYPDGAQMFLNAVKYMIPAKPKVIWVSFHGADDAPSAGAAGDGFTEAPDKGYTDLLKANGYDVTRYIQTGTPDVNVLNAADLVIVSRSVDGTSFRNAAATAWNGISAPMILVGSWTMLHTNRLGFVTGNNYSMITGDITLTVNDPTHPIFTGIPLTNGTMTNPYAGVVMYPTDGTQAHGLMIATGAANANGTVLATVSAAGNGPAGVMIIGEWPAGATLTHDGGAGTDTLGGHRLVFQTSSCTPGGKSWETAGMYDLYADGAQMFLNAVKYMIPAPKIVWVSFHGADDAPSAGAAGDGFTEAPDKGYTDLLKANGYDVTRYIQTSTPDVNVLNAADLVIVSRSVDNSSFENAAATAWNGISAPMIIVGSGAMHTNRLGFVTGTTISHITGDITLTVNDPTHPIFTGISLTNGTMTNPFAGVVAYPTDGTIAHGIMMATSAANANGTVLATVSAAGNGPAGVMIIGEWPAGATLTHDGGAAATDVLAGHRLVFQTSSCTPGGKNWQTAGMYDLYADGAQMFLNAVQYMLK